jgi:hypothetical protein
MLIQHLCVGRSTNRSAMESGPHSHLRYCPGGQQDCRHSEGGSSSRPLIPFRNPIHRNRLRNSERKPLGGCKLHHFHPDSPLMVNRPSCPSPARRKPDACHTHARRLTCRLSARLTKRPQGLRPPRPRPAGQAPPPPPPAPFPGARRPFRPIRGTSAPSSGSPGTCRGGGQGSASREG